MAAVFDGDPQPLYEIVLDSMADQFIRSRMCEVLAMLVLQGELDRPLVARFLRDAFMELQPQARNFVWQGWQSAIAMLGLSELKVLVKRACDRGFIDRDWVGFEDFERDLEWAVKRPGEPRHPHDNEFTLFGDTVEEPSRWSAFSDDYAMPGSGISKRLKLNLPKVNPTGIPSAGLAEMTPVLAAAA